MKKLLVMTACAALAVACFLPGTQTSAQALSPDVPGDTICASGGSGLCMSSSTRDPGGTDSLLNVHYNRTNIEQHFTLTKDFFCNGFAQVTAGCPFHSTHIDQLEEGDSLFQIAAESNGVCVGTHAYEPAFTGCSANGNLWAMKLGNNNTAKFISVYVTNHYGSRQYLCSSEVSDTQALIESSGSCTLAQHGGVSF
jgi:hypothetical protein